MQNIDPCKITFGVSSHGNNCLRISEGMVFSNPRKVVKMRKLRGIRIFECSVCILNQCIFLTLIAALFCALINCDVTLWRTNFNGMKHLDFIGLVGIPTLFLQIAIILFYPIAQLHVLTFLVFGGLRQIKSVRMRKKILYFSIRISIKSFVAFAVNWVLIGTCILYYL